MCAMKTSKVTIVADSRKKWCSSIELAVDQILVPEKKKTSLVNGTTGKNIEHSSQCNRRVPYKSPRTILLHECNQLKV